MKLRFWRREKKEEESLLDLNHKLRLGKNMTFSEDGLSIIKTPKFKGITNLGDLSMADNIDNDPYKIREKWDEHKPHVTDLDKGVTNLGDLSMADNLINKETIASKNMDFPKDEFPDGPIDASDDDIFAKEDQCQGVTKKTGRRCIRYAPMGYCWQHQTKGDE